MNRDRHPAIRIALLTLGGLLLVATPLVGLLPGPGGVFVFAAGVALLLQNSLTARRRYARVVRCWPRLCDLADRAMRRPSARRRRERASDGRD